MRQAILDNTFESFKIEFLSQYSKQDERIQD
jgi:hypothetical protein